jgi:glycosyltransferase involved in cell wall biosynthesis
LSGTPTVPRPKVHATVVIPTRGRRGELLRCLRALAKQETRRRYEVLVVDDGCVPPLTEGDLSDCGQVRVLQSERPGPAAARNTALREAAGRIVLFTDDDAIPERGWVEAASRFLDEHPSHVGVGGCTVSPPFDYLYERGVECDHQAFWTCNVAYRRDALRKLGGFFEGFKAAHCEDLDLGYRALDLGEIGFASDMRVTHPPRQLSLRDYLRRGQLAGAEALLYSRHPARYPVPPGLPRSSLPLAGVLSHWARALRAEGLVLVRSPRRLVRFLIAATGQSLITALSLVRLPRAWRRSL